ncbi:unnamed protein product [Dovyalis caffra]|uniref:Protein kinase domain-containing protein n=1 Tax=Dovyalis caffra TaxID=77055 RepID=A0AAV1R7P6_9ROSI|nr:unnamed protein product [Dovyalis caffra]
MGAQNPNLITFVIIMMFNLAHLAFTEDLSFTFERFVDEDHEKFLSFRGNSSIYLEALQLTPETPNDAHTWKQKNASGRIMYRKPFRFWMDDGKGDNGDGRLASFSTTFVINIYREKDWEPGHGLAFLIAPNVSIPEASYGQWLGLTNASTDGNHANHIVAIEFDTDDPENNHIGLNINSIRSKNAIPLIKHNITLSPDPPGVNYTVWVDYNGTSKLMEVYMVKEGNPKPQGPLLNETINLKEFLKQESYFGFAASTGDPHIELNCVLKWSLQINNQLDEKNDAKWWKIGAGVCVSVLTIIFIFVVCGVVFVRKKRSKARLEETSDEFGTYILKWLPGMPREFKYKELKKATNNFHESMKLGEGGFGVVYKGILLLHDEADDGNPAAATATEIAVKKFSGDSMKSKDDFLAELTIIHHLRHKNLVRLVGWCYEKGKLLLVYDFMPNGSLEKHLYKAPEQDTLNWNRRYKILAGVASALHYLHNEYDKKVVHRDLKASNILLDVDFNARLGDFGLARALENEKNSYNELGLGGVPGTLGYVAPECFHTGRATLESDVFGFGVVVLEVVCGKGPGTKIHHNQHLYSLVDWVWTLYREGCILEAVDENLGNDFEHDEANRLLLLGLACSHPIDSERPKTEAIIQIISGTLPLPRIPPFKPAFTWPSIRTIDSTTGSLSSIASSSQNYARTQSVIKLQRTPSSLPV